LHVRLSDSSKEKWDKQFIEKELKEHMDGLARVWVCGPPRMNEDFDKNLRSLFLENSLSLNKYEIM
jgi:predicted ferric reductase